MVAGRTPDLKVVVSNPNVGKNFSFRNFLLFRIPHSFTYSIKMKSIITLH